MKAIRQWMGLGSLLGVVVGTLGCQAPVRVDRWVEVPCQPHGFYIAPKGQTLADVAKTCQVEEALLIRHNAWLTTRQPFADNTVVWLRQDPRLDTVEAENLQIEAIDNSGRSSSLSAEALTPLNLPSRVVPAKRGAPRLSGH